MLHGNWRKYAELRDNGSPACAACEQINTRCAACKGFVALAQHGQLASVEELDHAVLQLVKHDVQHSTESLFKHMPLLYKVAALFQVHAIQHTGGAVHLVSDDFIRAVAARVTDSAALREQFCDTYCRAMREYTVTCLGNESAQQLLASHLHLLAAVGGCHGIALDSILESDVLARILLTHLERYKDASFLFPCTYLALAGFKIETSC